MERRRELTISRARVKQVLAAATDWKAAARELKISPGLVYMIDTGLAADRSGISEINDELSDGPRLTSPQSLVNPRGHNPQEHEIVNAWITARAKRELKQ